MIRHIFKMLWNQKKSYIAIFIEQLLVFIILMFCTVSVFEKVRQLYLPGLLETGNTVSYGYFFNSTMGRRMDQAVMMDNWMDRINEKLKKLPYVEAVSRSYDFVPYSRGVEGYRTDSVEVDKKKYKAQFIFAEREGQKVFKLKLVSGSWFSGQKLEDGSWPVVISAQLAGAIGWYDAIQKKIRFKDMYFTVVGVIAGIKQEAFTEAGNAIIIPFFNPLNTSFFYGENCARVNEGEKDAFASVYFNEFRKIVTFPNIEPVLDDVDRLKQRQVVDSTFGVVFQSVPTIFFLIFAFIGTFGLFWLYSRKRLKEFALRRAVGSTKNRLILLVVGESLTITFLSAVPGLILAFFIYHFNFVVILAILCTLTAMLFFSFISAWYPAYIVSKVNPAEALHYE